MISGGDPMSDRTMDRRTFVGLAAAGGAAAVESRVPALARGVSRPSAAPFELEEATIAELQAGMKSGKYTARGLTAAYVQRIDALDRKGPALRAVLEVNPDALAQAEALDAERKAKGPRGPFALRSASSASAWASASGFTSSTARRAGPLRSRASIRCT